MPENKSQSIQQGKIASEHYVSKDRTKLCSIYYLAEHGEPNIYAVKAVFPDVDAALSGEQARHEFESSGSKSTQDCILYRDPRLPAELLAEKNEFSLEDAQITYGIPLVDGSPILLTKAREDDACGICQTGKVKLKQAVEIGHTFHLGKRYSIPLEANVLDANNEQTPIEMGCHGIGVSRLIGAIASLLADTKGLNWPLAIAPFDVVVVGAGKADSADVGAVYDILTLGGVAQKQLDVVLDDRDKPIGWKLNDADLIGYPFIVVVGNAWKERGVVELQCRRLGLKTEEELDELAARIDQESRRL